MPSDESRVVVPSTRPVAVREIQLIDRAKEMEVLREATDRAIHGEGGVIFLHGEAGIGKTRLARELGAYAGSRGMQVLSGRCPALHACIETLGECTRAIYRHLDGKPKDLWIASVFIHLVLNSLDFSGPDPTSEEHNIRNIPPL